MTAPSPESLNDEVTDVAQAVSEDVIPEDVEDSENETPSWGLRHLRAWLYSLTSLIVIFLGAGAELWSCAVALILMGVTLCLAPPRFKLRPTPRLLLTWLALLPAVGLLPAAWFGPVEPWRTRLIQEWSVAVSSSLSPDFQMTFETWIISLFGLLWLWSCFGQNFSNGGRRVALHLLVIGSIVIAILYELEFFRFMRVPFWPSANDGPYSQDFGPFSNRNHSSSFFALCSVLSAGACLDAIRRKSRSWYFFLLAIVLLFASILSNTSRGGLLLFLIGLTSWLATAAMKKGLFRKLLVSIAVIAAIIASVLVSRGVIGERLVSSSSDSSFLQDTRAKLAADTLSSVATAPWLGRGMGVFDFVFPQITQTLTPEYRTIHPESDVLWLLFEGGLLLLIPVVILVCWFCSRSGPWFSQRKKHSKESRSGRRMRKAFAIAAFMGFAHGIFDVPLHGLGYFLLIVFVASLAVRPRYAGVEISLVSRHLFRVFGILMISFGIYLLLMFGGVIEPSISSMAKILHDRALSESSKGKHAEAMILINRAIELSPLDYRFYFLRAQLQMVLRHDRELALLDFGRARAVEPCYVDICLEEGRFWMRFDPGLAVIGWREGLLRYKKDSLSRLSQYSGVVAHYHHYADHHFSIWRLADNLPMQLTFLQQMLYSPHWSAIQKEFLFEHPLLDDLNENQVLFLFSSWQKHPEKSTLISFIKKSPRLTEIAWRLISQDLAQSGQFESAFKLAAKYTPVPARSSTITAADVLRLERAHLLNPVDILQGIELYYARRMSGDLKSSRLILEKVMKLPKAPDFLKRELASLLAEMGDFRGAWDLMRQIIEATPVESSALGSFESEDPKTQGLSAPEPRVPGQEL